MHGMVDLWRFGQFADGARLIDMANLFGPEVVFGHEHKASERAQKTRLCDAPTGFLEHFAVQRRDRAFSGINATAGKLKLVMDARLIGQKHLPISRQNGICARSCPI